MGTLAVTYDGTTKNITMSNAPVIAYGGKTLVSAGSWEGDKTLKCGGKWMISDVTIGNRTLKTKYTWGKSDIQINYTKASASTPSIVTESTTITVPEGYNMVQFFACGGGGGTDSYPSFEKGSAGAGGGGGYTNEIALSTTPGTTYILNIGPGGKKTDGTASTIYQDTTLILTAEGGKAATGNRYYSDYDSSKDSYTGYAGSGGSGGGNWTSVAKGGASGGTDGGDGAGASSGTSYSRGKGQGTTTKCSFMTNSPAYGAGGGGTYSSARSPIATVSDDSTSSDISINVYLEQARKKALASTEYALLAGGATGGGHGGCWYRGGKAFDTSSDGDTLHDFKGAVLAATSGTAGTGGGGGGGFYYYYDPANGYSGAQSSSGGNGGSGVIIYRFYEV